MGFSTLDWLHERDQYISKLLIISSISILHGVTAGHAEIPHHRALVSEQSRSVTLEWLKGTLIVVQALCHLWTFSVDFAEMGG